MVITEAGSRRTKSGHSESETSAIRTLTSVEPKNLNPENEMKKIFGSRVVLADVQRHNRRGSRTRYAFHTTGYNIKILFRVRPIHFCCVLGLSKSVTTGW